ncbi:MAG TPA: hypothetical protein VHM29_01130 [Acidimicrobiia bacterium]|jgi:uncharacterized membrane protein|nr:hypothetical protein [Acidimicrobiia bacterium]
MAVDLIFQLVNDPWTWGRGFAVRGLVWFLFMAFLALLALGVALLWRRGADDARVERSTGDEALDAVRLRYARGDMTREEFLQVTKDLGGPEPPPTD